MSKKKKLTNKQIIIVLKGVIERVNNYNNNKEVFPFICNKTASAISCKLKCDYEVVSKNMTDFIPLFTYENAVKYANADELDDKDNTSAYPWWDSGKNPYARYTTQGRIQFLEWLIKQYTKDTLCYKIKKVFKSLIKK